MTKAKHIGKNLDAPSSPPQQTTNIEPMAPPTIVNAMSDVQDVSPEGDSGATESKSSWRKNDMLESIYEKRNKQLAELAPSPEEDHVATEETAGGEAEDAPSEDNAASTPSPAVTEALIEEPTAVSTPQKYKIMVDSQPIEYTLEELLQQAQLGVAARKRFEEAAQMRNEAQMIVSRQNFQPQAAHPQPGNNNTQEQLTDIPIEELRDIAKRMNYGSEEEQVDALRKAISLGMTQGRAGGPTPEQIVNVVTHNTIAHLTAQQEQEILRREFPDIASDVPIAYATDLIATQLAQKYAALGQQKPRLDLLREAGTEARSKYLKPSAEVPQSQINSAAPAPIIVANNNKIERKRAAPQTPTAASAVASGSPDGMSNASPEAIAQAMRKNAMGEILKARGQAVI